jgi:hypothetical protein
MGLLSGGVLLLHPAVDAFTQQIGVPVVAGVLLDPVNPRLPGGDAVPARPRAQIRAPPRQDDGSGIAKDMVDGGTYPRASLRRVQHGAGQWPGTQAVFRRGNRRRVRSLRHLRTSRLRSLTGTHSNRSLEASALAFHGVRRLIGALEWKSAPDLG